MTTPPIVSITDELISELEVFVSTPVMFAGTVRPIQDAMRALLAERAELKRDAERYRWLRGRLVGSSFDWDDEGMVILAFEIPDNVAVSASCDKVIDAAMQS